MRPVTISILKDSQQNPEQMDEFADNEILDNRDGTRKKIYHTYPITFDVWMKQEVNNDNKNRRRNRILIPMNPREGIYDSHNRYTSKISLDNWKTFQQTPVSHKSLLEM